VSEWDCTVETSSEFRVPSSELTADAINSQLATHNSQPQYLVRLGLRYVAGLRAQAAKRVVDARRDAAFASLQDMVDRASLHRNELSALARAGALNAFGLTRRSALWQVERAARPRGPLFDGLEDASEASPLADMTLAERLDTDLRSTSLTIGPHPMALFRESLAARGALRAFDVERRDEGDFVRVAGAVICRQRPGTAKGFLFLTLEDETGVVNVIVRPDLYEKETEVLVRQHLLEIDGVLQKEGGVSVRAVSVRPARLPSLRASESRDFH